MRETQCAGLQPLRQHRRLLRQSHRRVQRGAAAFEDMHLGRVATGQPQAQTRGRGLCTRGFGPQHEQQVSVSLCGQLQTPQIGRQGTLPALQQGATQ